MFSPYVIAIEQTQNGWDIIKVSRPKENEIGYQKEVIQHVNSLYKAFVKAKAQEYASKMSCFLLNETNEFITIVPLGGFLSLIINIASGNCEGIGKISMIAREAFNEAAKYSVNNQVQFIPNFFTPILIK